MNLLLTSESVESSQDGTQRKACCRFNAEVAAEVLLAAILGLQNFIKSLPKQNKILSYLVGHVSAISVKFSVPFDIDINRYDGQTCDSRCCCLLSVTPRVLITALIRKVTWP